MLPVSVRIQYTHGLVKSMECVFMSHQETEYVLAVYYRHLLYFFFFQAEDGIRDHCVTGVQTCALPISRCAQRQGPDDRGAREEHRARRDGRSALDRRADPPRPADELSRASSKIGAVLRDGAFFLRRRCA